jgi:hypothetical protein
MEIEALKQKLRSFIDSTNDADTLINLLHAAGNKASSTYINEKTYLSEEDYEELLSLVNEPPEKDTVSYEELKSSLSRWFTK